MSVAPFAVPRRPDGSFNLMSAGEITMFDYTFAQLSALPSDITASVGTGATVTLNNGSGVSTNVKYMQLLTGSSANQQAGAAWKALDTAAFEWLWMRAIIRVPDSGKPNNTIIGMYGASNEGSAWYEASGELVGSYNNGDTPVFATQPYLLNSRWATREVGMLMLPPKKACFITDGKNIIAGGAWSTFVGGSITPRIYARDNATAARRMDVLRWRLDVGLA